MSTRDTFILKWNGMSIKSLKQRLVLAYLLIDWFFLISKLQIKIIRKQLLGSFSCLHPLIHVEVSGVTPFLIFPFPSRSRMKFIKLYIIFLLLATVLLQLNSNFGAKEEKIFFYSKFELIAIVESSDLLMKASSMRAMMTLRVRRTHIIHHEMK